MSGGRSRFRVRAVFVLSIVLPALRAQILPLGDYTATEGLPHNGINDILLDSHGFLWFSTSGGLSRFNGYEFTNYGARDGLPSERVNTVFETRRGEYWVGTSGGLCRFNPTAKAGSRFTVYRPADRNAWQISAIFEDGAGTLWCGTRSGLYRFQSAGAASSWERIDLISSHAQPAIGTLVEDRDGALWIGSVRGLFRRNADGAIDRYWTDDRSWNTGRARVNALVSDSDGALWVASWGGLWKINPRAGRERLSEKRVPGISGAVVWSAFSPEPGHLSIGTNAGICEIDATSDRVLQCYSKSNGIVGPILALAADRGGDIWLGTETIGAMRMARHGFLSFPLTERAADVFETRAGEFCVGHALRVSMLEDGRFRSIAPRFPSAITKPGWGSRQTVLQDRAGDWWFPTGQGLYRFGPAKSVKALAGRLPKAVYTHRDGLASDNIFRAFEDRTGDIWVACQGMPGSNGVSRWERATGQWRHYFRAPAPSTLRDSLVSAFGQDRSGAMWFGFWVGQLARLRDGMFQFFTEADGWRGGEVRAIHEDRYGALWIASTRGLTALASPEAASPRFRNFSSPDGISGNDVLSVASDDSGRIYIGTGRGVDQIEPVRSGDSIALGRVRHYTTAEGLRRGAMSIAYKDRRGAMWFVSDEGVSRFNPTQAPPLLPSTPLIRALRIAGVPMPISELGETALSISHLKPSQNNIQIEYSGVNFDAAETVRYQYKLEGADGAWGQPTTQRSVNYANLSPGSYRFLVRVADPAERGSAVASVAFRIDSPIWSRWWFLALLAAALGAGIRGFYRLRLNRLLELERVRTRIATDLHDDVGSNLSQIAILSEVALQRHGASAAQETLARIAEVSRETVHSMSDIVWAVDPEHDRLSDLTNRMHRFANDLLSARNIALDFHCSTQYEVRVAANVRREIFLVFKECVNNAVRHSGCDAVQIDLAVQNGAFSFRLRDNGKGFDPSSPTDGHGLISMRRRAQALGGEIEVASGGEGGASVLLRVPLPRGILHV